ncbi:3-deoxy-8-phosphooctulonate synthase [Membranihabitans marinus]|uniref:3-deoxy-8-phosphooctulonate synthase n=1 Tax=Membranihabitans marinus TaxID=1227546 RepID=UPI001F002BF1|nr:3-deoxy-8-phosphooctulonate synthase [Membranihabitans marinus]
MDFTEVLRQISNSKNFFLIAGPCAVESEEVCFEVADHLSHLSTVFNIPIVFKSSFKKANRSSIHSFTGIGDIPGLEILRAVKNKWKMPVLTDIHTVSDASMAADYVDVLQIPAFLCRQTDLLLAAAATGKTINIKKGQFLAPESMIHAVEKLKEVGHDKIWLTERGNSFGYHDLVVDFRSIPIMQQIGLPVVMDCTHSNQKPNQTSGVTGGAAQFIDTMACAAVAVGVDGLFIETHPNPSVAKSDAANMLPLNQLEKLLEKLSKIRQAIS